MNIFCSLLFVATLSGALAGKLLHPLSDEYISNINAKQTTWKAGRNFEIKDWELVKVLASGVKADKEPLKYVRNIHDESQDVPESFDSREAWPECASVIAEIRDQSRCGSCWAFGAAESMSDRICIHSNGTRKAFVSSQDILTCANAGGCAGGWPSFAWESWVYGLVTGGLYNRTDQGCKSYFLPPCDDHPNKCELYVQTPDCVESCDDASVTYEDQKTYGLEPMVFDNEKQIQLEILKNGPVEAVFDVYEDLASYKSGIYQQTSRILLGGHAIKIIGWGVEDGINYWLIANSWNERWGENGYFRMIRGRDECGIESQVIAGLPNFTKF